MNVNVAFAPFAAFEAHAGIMASLAPLCHIAFDGFVLSTYSPEGYGPATGDFWSVSPGVRLRLIIGKSGN